jgi:hypothetical protein
MEALHTASRLTCPLKCETIINNDKKYVQIQITRH